MIADAGGRDPRSTPLALLALSFLAVAIFFAQIWNADLYDDPALYASIARQMLDTGEWWSPSWGPGVYFRKPPLMLWMTALNFRVFGVSPGVAAFWPRLAALLSVLLTYRLARRWFGEWPAVWSGIILATTPRFVKGSFSLRLDSGLVCLLLGATLATFSAVRGRPRLHLLAGILVGLGILVKGPVGLLGLVPYGYLMLFRPGDGESFPPADPWWRSGFAWSGLALALVLPGVWYGSMAVLHGPVFLQLALGEIGGHVLESRAPSPVGTYLQVLLYYYWPWLLFLPVGVFAYWRLLRERGLRWVGSYPAVFLLAYGALLMLAATKHNRYLQPMYPYLAMLCSLPVAHLISDRRRVGFLKGLTVAALLLTLVINLIPVRIHAHRNGRLEEVARQLGESSLEVAVSGPASDHNLQSVLLFHGRIIPREMEPGVMGSSPPTGECFHLFYRPEEEPGILGEYRLSEIRSFAEDRLPLKLAHACRNGI